ncbi:MAG: DMT family transporter [Rhodospirillaceae bacterium]
MNTARPASPLLPIALLFAIGALWGGFFVLIKLGVTGGVEPANYLFWFTLLAGSWLFLAGALRGNRPRFARDHIPYYLRLGLVRFTLANLIMYTVQGKLPVGLMAIIMAFTPIFTYLISLLMRVDRFLWFRSAGILLGFGGALLIVIPRSSLPDPELSFWVLLGFGAPLLHAIAYVALNERARPTGVDSITLSSGTLYAACVLALPIALATGAFQWPGWPLSGGEKALLAHSLIAAVNFYCIFELIRIAGPTYMSQANFLSVGFGVLFGIVIFGETHSAFVWGAIGLMLSGVALVNLKPRRKPQSN